MNCDEILIGLYRGRQIVGDEFNKYFHAVHSFNEGPYQPNCSENRTFAYKVEGIGPKPYIISVAVKGDTVDHVTVEKQTVHYGRGIPAYNEHELSASDKKYVYEICDKCFPSQAEDEIDSVIDFAIAQNSEYDGYRIVKRLKEGTQFIAPDGTKGKVPTKLILHALDFSHSDIRILRDAETASEFMKAFCSTPFQPLFAILQTVSAEDYPNYKHLDNEYRFHNLEREIENGKLNSCKDYVDILVAYPKQISWLCGKAIRSGNLEILQWILDNSKQINYDVDYYICRAVENDNEQVFYALLNSGKYDVTFKPHLYPSSAVVCAVKSKECNKYLIPLLQHGYYLSASYGAAYYSNCSLDQIKELLHEHISLDQRTVNRIVKEQRWDIIDILETNPSKLASTQMLLIAYLYGKQFERFADGVSRQYDISSRDLLNLAFQNGPEWADLLLENGFDININNAYCLRCACETEDVAFVSYLLSRGANPYIHEENSRTVMETAVFHTSSNTHARAEICKILMDNGVDPILESHSTPSCICYMNEFPREFKFFLCDWLAAHGKLNVRDCDSIKGPTHVPIYYVLADEELAIYYLSHGAKAVAKGISLDALFVEACSSASTKVLEKMLQCGADVNEKDIHGRFGLWIALKKGESIEKIRFLVEHGADVNCCLSEAPTSNYGRGKSQSSVKSILDVAVEICSVNIVEYLKSVGAKHGSELVTSASKKENYNPL